MVKKLSKTERLAKIKRTEEAIEELNDPTRILRRRIAKLEKDMDLILAAIGNIKKKD